MNKEEKEAIELLKQEPDFSLSYYKREHAIDIALNLIDKQQKEIDYLQTKTKQNENIEKIKMCMTHNMPNNVEIVCMVREDFERNFENDYIGKDKIREIIKDLEEFDTNFYTSEELKLAIKNSLKELLGE